MTTTITITESEFAEYIRSWSDERINEECSNAFKADCVRHACDADLVADIRGKAPAPKAKKTRVVAPHASPATVRPETLASLLSAVRKGCTTRDTIAANAGISIATASKGLLYLVNKGEVTQLGKRNAKFAAVTQNGAAEASP